MLICSYSAEWDLFQCHQMSFVAFISWIYRRIITTKQGQKSDTGLKSLFKVQLCNFVHSNDTKEKLLHYIKSLTNIEEKCPLIPGVATSTRVGYIFYSNVLVKAWNWRQYDINTTNFVLRRKLAKSKSKTEDEALRQSRGLHVHLCMDSWQIAWDSTWSVILCLLATNTTKIFPFR